MRWRVCVVTKQEQSHQFSCLSSTVNSLSLRAGSSNHSSGGILYSLANGYIHGYYNASLIDYDVAVLEVSSPFQLGVPGINTVSLPRPGYYPRNGTILYVSGWGYTTVS